MAQDILTLFVYLFGLVLIITIIDVVIAMFQIIEDIPLVREKIWKLRTRDFRNINNARS